VATGGRDEAAVQAVVLAGRADGADAQVVHTAVGPADDARRRAADRELVAVLAASGFAGPQYDRFRDELAKYGVSVLRGWMSSGYIFHLLARRGLSLGPTEEEIGELHGDADLRDELAVMVVAVALRQYREQALLGGGWQADGGASLTTYFMGACLSAFPNEFRRHRTQKRRWRAQDTADAALAAAKQTAADSADAVAGDLRVRAELARLEPRTRAIVALSLDGYRQEEIAEMLGENSARAVEGVLYRWRSNQIRHMRKEAAT
jgi:DNA-directed RNA polymerase specialized sigma24 family protein